MTLVYAALAIFSISTGTVLTRNLMSEYFPYEPIGPLFLLNGVFAIPVMLAKTRFIIPSSGDFLLLFSVAILTSFGAFLVFFVIKKSTPATSLVGQSLSPVPLLFLNSLIFGEKFSIFSGLVSLLMVVASALAIGEGIGFKSSKSILFIFLQSTNAAVIALLINKLINRELPLYEIVVFQQLGSGLISFLIKPPKNFTFSLLPIYSLRSIFMSLGWIFTALSLSTHKIFESQAIISLTPLVATFIQTIRSKTRSPFKLWVSGVFAFICVLVIHFFSLK